MSSIKAERKEKKRLKKEGELSVRGSEKDNEEGDGIERLPIQDILEAKSNRSRVSGRHSSTMSKKNEKKAKKLARKIMMLEKKKELAKKQKEFEKRLVEETKQ